jgi:hypothetical protein
VLRHPDGVRSRSAPFNAVLIEEIDMIGLQTLQASAKTISVPFFRLADLAARPPKRDHHSRPDKCLFLRPGSQKTTRAI